MAYFNFLRLIKKYYSEFELLVYENGYYDDKGEYIQDNATKTTLKGAIIGYKESKVYRSEGTLTSQDKRLFTFEPICAALLGANVIYKSKKYCIEAETENAKFTDIYTYNLKFISAFNEKKINQTELNKVVQV